MREHAAGQFGQDALLSQAAYLAKLDQIVWDAEDELSELMDGQDSVVFLAPMGAHNAIAFQWWRGNSAAGRGALNLRACRSGRLGLSFWFLQLRTLSRIF